MVWPRRIDAPGAGAEPRSRPESCPGFHQDGISNRPGRGSGGGAEITFAVGQVNGYAVLRSAPALRVGGSFAGRLSPRFSHRSYSTTSEGAAASNFNSYWDIP